MITVLGIEEQIKRLIIHNNDGTRVKKRVLSIIHMNNITVTIMFDGAEHFNIFIFQYRDDSLLNKQFIFMNYNKAQHRQKKFS
jgi:hypothetical protein